MEWQYLLKERNNMFYKIVDEWPVQNSVDATLEILLGAVNDTMKELDAKQITKG
jgi:hypothetical protein